jgi:hypothetical protein
MLLHSSGAGHPPGPAYALSRVTFFAALPPSPLQITVQGTYWYLASAPYANVGQLAGKGAGGSSGEPRSCPLLAAARCCLAAA